MTSKTKNWLKANFQKLLVVLVLLIGFVPVSLTRLIARDEGFYLYAAKNVFSGQALYFDFFYPQMPLLPFVYGAWFKIFGATWYSARLLCAFFCVALGLLLFEQLRFLRNAFLAWVAIVLFITSNFVFPWYTTSQTYALTCFLLFCSYFLFSSSSNQQQQSLYSRRIKLLLAGIAFGLCVSTRLMMLGLGPFVLLYIILNSKGRSRTLLTEQLGLLGLGALIGLAPSLYYCLADFDRFYFNNFAYHLLRSEFSFWDDLKHNFRIFKVLLGLKESIKFKALQFGTLVLFSLVCLIFKILKREKINLAFYIIFGLLIINFLPRPSYVQYFCILVPFLIITSLEGIAELCLSFKPLGRLTGKIAQAVLLIFFLWFYFNKLPSDYLRYTKTGDGVIGIRTLEEAKHWNIKNISKISNAISIYSEAGEEVYSPWPGYLFQSHARAVKGFENHFGLKIARKLEPSQRAKYNLLAGPELHKYLAQHSVALAAIPLRSQNNRIHNRILERSLELETLGKVLIMELRPAEPSAIKQK